MAGVANNSPGEHQWMNRYSRVRLYLERAESFSDRAISLLKRMDLESGYSKEIADFEDAMFRAGIDGRRFIIR